MSELPRPKIWRHPVILTEHVFDKLWQLDITMAEFRELLDGSAEVIEDTTLEGARLK